MSAPTVWDLRSNARRDHLRKFVSIGVPDPEIAIVASSSYTREDVDRRLATLRAAPTSPEVEREIAFLRGLLARDESHVMAVYKRIIAG